MNLATRWQPLLESDNLGFLFYQEHVVPHIGFTGKSFFFSDEFFCSHTSDDPNYDYDVEMDLAIQRTRDLNDVTKMEIEFFDDKLSSLFPLQSQFYAKQGKTDLDDWDVISSDVIIVVLAYEAAMLVWKEKLNWDRVRPPSIIHDQMSGQVKYSVLLLFVRLFVCLFECLIAFRWLFL